MKTHHSNLSQRIFAFLFSLLTMSCVSVNIKPKAPERSQSYKFEAPGLPFERIKSESTDLTFRDPRNGHTMALISECSESFDPNLENLEEEITSTLSSSKVENTQEITFNDRLARRSLYSGKMDGIDVNIEVLVFKKNSCAYTLTFFGKSAGFQSQQKYFQKFVQSFEVP